MKDAPRDADGSRGVVDLLDEVLLHDLACWPFLVLEPTFSAPTHVADRAASTPLRGAAPSKPAEEAITTLMVIDELTTGAGSLCQVRVRLGDATSEPGLPVVHLAIEALAEDAPSVVSWDGPVSGRIVVDGAAFDFGADGESRLVPRDGGFLATLRLGTEWVERDASGNDLLGGLQGIVVFREPSEPT